MSFISKVELRYQLKKMGINVVEGNYIKKRDIENLIRIKAKEENITFTVDIGWYDHSGKDSADWESFKKSKGSCSQISADQIQKIADKYFPILEKIGADKNSCSIEYQGNCLDLIYTPKDKTKDFYAQITFLFEKEGRELNLEKVSKIKNEIAKLK